MIRRGLVAAAILAAGGAVAAAVALRSAGSEVESIRLGFHPAEGEQRTFGFSLTTHGEARSVAFGDAPPRSAGASPMGELVPFRFATEGALRWTALGPKEAVERVLVELEDAHTAVGGPSALRAAAPPLSGLRFILRVGPTGRVVELELPPGLDAAQKNVARSIASYLEVVGTEAPAREWTVEQALPEGPVRATYVVSAAGHEVRLTRRDVGQESAQAGGALGGREHRIEGGCDLHLQGATAVPVALSCQRDDTRRTGARVLARQSTRFALEPRGSTRLEGAALEALRARVDAAPVIAVAVDGRAEAAEQERLAAEQWAKTHTLEPALGAALVEEDAPEALRTLMAHLTTNPAAAAAVGRALEQQPPSGRGFQRLADALARAGTEAAQAALTAAADRSGQDGRTATLLTVHQGMARAPGALLEASLRRKAAAPGDAQSTAQLALGVVASRLAGTDPARHGALVADLAARYRAANTDAARVHWLHVLGNTASPEVARIAADALVSPAEEVRRAAVHALRDGSSAEACDALTTRLRQDSAPVVRAAAAGALSTATSCAAFDALAAALAEERDEQVVRATLEALAAFAASEPRALAALEEYQRTCGLASLCRTAKVLAMAVRGRS